MSYTTANSYADGNYCFDAFGKECSSLLYSGVLGTSGSVGSTSLKGGFSLKYYFSQAYLQDKMSLNFEKSVIGTASKNSENGKATKSETTSHQNTRQLD